MKHLDALVLVVIIVALIAITIFMNKALFDITSGSADVGCATSVRVRATAIRFEMPSLPELKDCKTRHEDFTGWKEKDIRDEIVSDFAWCYASFGGDSMHTILSRTDTFCHVCAIYNKNDFGEVGGVFEDIEKKVFVDVGTPETVGDELFNVLNVREDGELRDASLVFTQTPAALIYVQDKSEEHTLLTRIFGSTTGTGVLTGGVLGTAAWFVPGIGSAKLVLKAASFGLVSGVFIGSVVDPQEDLVSGIVISAYDEKAIDELGCTTTKAT